MTAFVLCCHQNLQYILGTSVDTSVRFTFITLLFTTPPHSTRHWRLALSCTSLYDAHAFLCSKTSISVLSSNQQGPISSYVLLINPHVSTGIRNNTVGRVATHLKTHPVFSFVTRNSALSSFASINNFFFLETIIASTLLTNTPCMMYICMFLYTRRSSQCFYGLQHTYQRNARQTLLSEIIRALLKGPLTCPRASRTSLPITFTYWKCCRSI